MLSDKYLNVYGGQWGFKKNWLEQYYYMFIVSKTIELNKSSFAHLNAEHRAL